MDICKGRNNIKMQNNEKEYEIEDVENNCDNEDYMEKALESGAAWVIAYADEKIHSNKKIMLKAVKIDGQMLYYASKEIRDDKEVVLEAVKNKWLILKYASKRLRGDKDIVTAALSQNMKAIIYATEKLQNDKEFLESFSTK